MPQDPRLNNQGNKEEYRRQQMAKAQKRKKRRQQKMIVLGAFALAIIILVVCIVLVIRSIFKKDGDSTTTTTTTSFSSSELGGGDTSLGWPTAADKSAWNLWLVNGQHPLDADFAYPEMTEVVNNGVQYWFDERMWPSLEQMIADCNAVEGNNLTFYAGFRSYNKQNEKFQYFVDLYTKQGKSAEEAQRLAREHAEPAGTADNHTALSVEFMVQGDSEPSNSFISTPEYDWLLKNAASYGFILRYPAHKTDITGVPFKAYQFRYVGAEDAAIINKADICLEEYMMTVSTSGTEGGGEGTSLPADVTTSGEDPTSATE